MPGLKGDRGLQGSKGDQGPQGPEVQVNSSTMETYIHPVNEKIKLLDMEVQAIKGMLSECLNSTTKAVACHLYGNGTRGTFIYGTVVTYWTTTSGVLTDGMAYSDGYITVPVDGIYYVYAQLWSDPQPGQRKSGFYIYHNNDIIGRVFDPRIQILTQYGGFVRSLHQGDRLSVQLSHTSYYDFSFPYTVFGCFRLHANDHYNLIN